MEMFIARRKSQQSPTAKEIKNVIFGDGERPKYSSFLGPDDMVQAANSTEDIQRIIDEKSKATKSEE